MKILGFRYLDRDKDAVDCDAISVSFQRDWSLLQQTIEKDGILSPILARCRQNRWEIVSGKGRWLCSKESRIPAMEIDCDDLEALRIHVYENFQRGFNAVERAKIVDALHNRFGISLRNISMEYASLLCLPLGSKILSDHLSILRFPTKILSHIGTGVMDWKTSLILLDFEPDDALALADLSIRMRWNSNRQKEVWSFLWEISRRDIISARDVLERPDIKELWSKENCAVYSDEFRKRLKKMKNVHLSRYEDAFAQVVQEHNSEYPIVIEASPAFEKEDIHAHFSFKDTETFHKALVSLSDLEKDGTVEKLSKIARME